MHVYQCNCAVYHIINFHFLVLLHAISTPFSPIGMAWCMAVFKKAEERHLPLSNSKFSHLTSPWVNFPQYGFHLTAENQGWVCIREMLALFARRKQCA
jgi:hypothetical protein